MRLAQPSVSLGVTARQRRVHAQLPSGQEQDVRSEVQQAGGVFEQTRTAELLSGPWTTAGLQSCPGSTSCLPDGRAADAALFSLVCFLSYSLSLREGRGKKVSSLLPSRVLHTAMETDGRTDTRLRLLHRTVFFFPLWKLFTSCRCVFQGQSRHWVGCSGLSVTHYTAASKDDRCEKTAPHKQ